MKKIINAKIEERVFDNCSIRVVSYVTMDSATGKLNYDGWVPYFNQDGTINKEAENILYMAKKQSTVNQQPKVNDVKINEQKETALDKRNKLSKVENVVVYKPKKWFNKLKNWVIIGLVGTLFVTIIGLLSQCKKEPTIGQNYTTGEPYNKNQFNRKQFEKAVAAFYKEIKARNLNVTEEQAREFIAFMNIDRIVNDDLELAEEYFSSRNANEVLSNAGHMIGILMSDSMQNQYKKSINLSNYIVGSDFDKNCVKYLENTRNKLNNIRNEQDGIYKAQLDEQEQNDVNSKISEVISFCSGESVNVHGDTGLETIHSMGDGARFVSVLVMNEIALANKNVMSEADYLSLQSLSSNEATVGNIQNLINNCKGNTYSK